MQINMLDYIENCNDIEEIKHLSNSIADEQLTKIFWDSCKILLREDKSELERAKAAFRCRYINKIFSSSIPVTKKINKFRTPHGFNGIAISCLASIGTGCTIFQNVTIGSNTLKDSSNVGFPVIGNNVYIGAGATIIGNVKIGDNVRIGAGCFVNKDVKENCTIFQADPIVIRKNKKQDNTFVTANSFLNTKATQGKDRIHKFLNDEEQKQLDNAFSILFAGDLILLEDQVKNAYKDGKYDFTPNFEYTKKYISNADFSIGVFEGPTGGNVQKYSQGNFSDGKRLYINFPDEYADAVKDAGFNLVTTANNHVLDTGIEGLKRTIDVLREKNLDFIGSYKSLEEKENNRVKIVEKDGIKMAFLSYTSSVNGYTKEKMLEDDMSYLTSIIVGKDKPYYDKILETVRLDFEKAKSYNPDLIIVMPHWGTQFADSANPFQKLWRKNFIEFGADIILGDHTHSVQPVEIEEVNGKTVYTVYCPGNYANIYREYNGDASAMIEIYIDRETKKIIGNSVIPMWTQSLCGGNYRALPLYEILNNEKLKNEVSTNDMERVCDVSKHITSVMLKTELDLSMVLEKYYFNGKNFLRKMTKKLELDENIQKSKFYEALSSAQNVCFVGDSIVHGTKNGGVPYYEPLRGFISGKIFKCGWGSSTTKTLLKNHIEEILGAKADLFVISIGTNDVRYRNENMCSMDSFEYVKHIEILKNKIAEKQPCAKFVFIAPWVSTDGDFASVLKYDEKIKMNEEYTKELKNWCEANGFLFVNPNPYIQSHLDIYPRSKYLLDAIHPNAQLGVMLYARAVFE